MLSLQSNDGILNSLLTALNERVYTNEGQAVEIPVESFFSASNEIPNFNDSTQAILAMVLYQLSRINKSNFALVHFASDIKTDFFAKDEDVSSQKILDCAETFLNGGTDFEKPLREAFALTGCGKMDKPDIVFIADGICDVSDAFLDLLEEFKADTGAKLTGILLDEGECFDFSLKKFADKIYRTSELLKDEIVDDIISDRL